MIILVLKYFFDIIDRWKNRMQQSNLFIKGLGILMVILFVSQWLVPMTNAWANEGNSSSTIGGIEIKVKKESEIKALLADSILKWKSEPIIVQGTSGKVEIPAQIIQFNVEETVANYMHAVKNPWYKPWKKTPTVHLPIQVELSDEIEAILMDNPFFKVEETKEAILEHAQFLQTKDMNPAEITISKELMDRNAFDIQAIHGNRASLLAFIDLLDGIILAPNEIFSFLEKMDVFTGANDFETRRFFTSVLYSVVLQADTAIIERHSQNKIPNYLRPGIEVEISERLTQDLKFQNTSDSPMLFQAHLENDHLLIELYTLKGTEKATYSVVEKEIKPRTIYRLSPEVKSGQEKVLETGRSGYRVTVSQTIYNEVSGQDLTTEVSRDFYPPVHKVIAVSSIERKQEGTATENTGAGNNSTEKEESKNPEKPTDQDTSTNVGHSATEDVVPDKETIYDKGGNVVNDPNGN